MASLTGQTIASTYDALLKITDNGPITASLKQITDGLGNTTPLYLSATTVFVDGNFRLSGPLYDTNNNPGTSGQILFSTGTGVDWQNFSESGLISGSGTTGYIPKFTAAGSIGNSIISESVSGIGIGISATEKLHVDGNGLFTGTLTASNVSGSNTGDETKASIETKLGAATSSNSGYLTSTDWSTFNTKQAALNGTGFVKISGTTISYDNSTYALAARTIATTAPLSGGGDLTQSRTISIAQATALADGYLSKEDWANFNAKQGALTLTTNNDSGASTLVGTTLNIPTYTLSGLGGVPSGRTLTINGQTQDLSANRTFTVNVGVTSFNTRSGAVTLSSSDVTTALGFTPASNARTLTINGVGYDLSADRSWSVGTVTSVGTSAPLTGGTITGSGTIGINQSGAAADGYLSSTDWNTFNNKQNALGYTPENAANKGIAGGYASLDGAGKVPSTQLPSYVDDVVEVVNFAALPATGETGKIYITLDNNFVYRWSGSVYVKISEPNAVWGSITGTLSNQTDLQNALNAKQNTLTNPVTGTGTTNTLPKFTGASTIGNSNISDSGTLITLTGNSYVNGNLGVGTTSLTQYGLRVSRDVTGSAQSVGISSDGTILSGVTSAARLMQTVSYTTAAAFTLADLYHFGSYQGSIGAGSTVTRQHGFYADSSLTGATNNYGFYGNIPSGANRWNLYMNGTASNYLAGPLGIGTTSIGQSALAINYPLTGSAISVLVAANTSLGTDVTSRATLFFTQPSTPASTFTVGNIEHYRAQQGTFGAGSTVTDQNGFIVTSNLIGAANNYGFRGLIPSGSGRWNLYMDGTADNYLAGRLLIGTTSSNNSNVSISRTLTGSVTQRGIFQNPTIASDVTNNALIFSSAPSTQAASFNLNALNHFHADLTVIGAGSSVNNQYGFQAAGGVIGATNNFGFYGNIAAGSGNWNIYMNGTANNYLAGSLGIGNTTLTGINLRVTKNITGAALSYGVLSSGTIQSDVTTTGHGFATQLGTQATTFTLPNLYHFRADITGFGAGSTVTRQAGFSAGSSLVGATSNYGFFGSLPSGTGNWNLYMEGAANNYLAGSLGIGSTSLANASLRVARSMTGGTTAFGVDVQGNFLSDVTSSGFGFSTFLGTQAAAFTLTNLTHYRVGTGTIGAGSTVTNQTGFSVDQFLTGGVNNFGFRGSIPSGTGRWNLYMDGTAANYLAGNLGIGTTSAKSILHANGSIFSGGAGDGFEANGANTYMSVAVGPGISRGIRTSVTSDSGFAGMSIVGMSGTFSTSGLPSTGTYDKQLLYLDGNSGNFGIGTASPYNALTIQGSTSRMDLNDGAGASRKALLIEPLGYGGNSYARIESYNYGTSTGGNLVLNGTGGNVGIGATNPTDGKLQIGGTSQLGNTICQTYFGVGAAAMGVTSGGAWTLGVDGAAGATERVRVTPAGDFLVGATSNVAADTGVKLFGQSGSLLGTISQSKDYSSGTILYTSFETATPSAAQVGSITYNGSAVAYNTSSDYRLKQDLKDYNGLSIVDKIKTYDYEWKSNGSRSYGVLAHELEEVLPYAVVGEKDGEQMQGVDYSKIVPVLVKAIQEQQAQIEELKAKLK